MSYKSQRNPSKKFTTGTRNFSKKSQKLINKKIKETKTNLIGSVKALLYSSKILIQSKTKTLNSPLNSKHSKPSRLIMWANLKNQEIQKIS